ncbi:hypothetical protein ACTFIZ_008754 [Dictyostelium cf. discoideum]
MVKKSGHPQSIKINETKKTVIKTKAPIQVSATSKTEKEILEHLTKIHDERNLVYKSILNHTFLVLEKDVPPDNLCKVLSDLLGSLKKFIYQESQLKVELENLKSVATTTTTTTSSTSNTDNNINDYKNNNHNNNQINNNNNNNQNNYYQNNNNQYNNNNNNNQNNYYQNNDQNNNNKYNNYNFTPISKPVISGVGLIPIISVESWGGGFVENFLNDKKLMDINHISPPLESNDLNPLSSHAWSSFPSSSPNKIASTYKTFDINFISPPLESNDLTPPFNQVWSSSPLSSPNKRASGSKTRTPNKTLAISTTTSTMATATNVTTASTAFGPTTESTMKKRGRPCKIVPDSGCFKCKTKSTPYWRKVNIENKLVDLCNACGLRHYKTEKTNQLSKKLNSIFNVIN